MNMNGSRSWKSRLTAVIGAAALVLSAASCSAKDEGSPAEGDSASSDLLPVGEGKTTYPLELESVWGSTTLEKRPERIAVLGLTPDQDAVEILGVTPVYWDNTVQLDWTWQDRAMWDGIEHGEGSGTTSAEQIAASDPDLIVSTTGISEEEFEQWSVIAPVLAFDHEVDIAAFDWRESQRLIGEALDLADAAETAIADAEERVKEVAAEHPEFAGKTATIAHDYGEESGGLQYLSPTGGLGESLLLELGFAPNPRAETFAHGDVTVSEEMVKEIDADVLITFYHQPEFQQAREGSELFSSVPAVADGRYLGIVVDSSKGDPILSAAWVLRMGASALSIPWAVEQIADWASTAMSD